MGAKTERIEARIDPETRGRIEEAAELEGRSTSSFVVDAAADRADEVLRSWRETVVPADYFDALLCALDEPDEPNPALRRAAERRRRRLNDDGDGPDQLPKRTIRRASRLR